MLRKFGNFFIRFKFAVVVFWIAAAGILYFTAPNLSDIISNDQASFLPASAGTVKADRLIRELFGEKSGRSSVVIVFKRQQGLTEGDLSYMKDIRDRLEEDKAGLNIREIVSPFQNKELEKALISQDKSVALEYVNLSVPAFTTAVEESVASISDIVKSGADGSARPDGIEVYMTGDATMSRDINESVAESMDVTVKITIILVALILIIVYRSPFAALVPLFAIGLSYLISQGIVGLLANEGFKVSNYTGTFLLAVLFGAGTDYCLLIISRYREETAAGKGTADALSDAVSRTSPAIITSGATVIVGFLCMAFAKFGLYNGTGPSVAIGVAVALLAVITLVPAFISVFGTKIFWPSKIRAATVQNTKPSAWMRIAALVARKPAKILLITLISFAPFIFMAGYITLSFDELKELPPYKESVKGYEIMSEKFSEGDMMPVKIVIKTENDMWASDTLKIVDRLADNLLKVDSIEKVRTSTRPLGNKLTEVSLSSQFEVLADGVSTLDGGLGELGAGLVAIGDGIDKIAEGTAEGGNGLGSMSDATGKAADGILQSGKAMDSFSSGISGAMSGMNEIGSGLLELKSALDMARQGLDSSNEAIGMSIGALDGLAAANTALAQNSDFMTACFALKNVKESLNSISQALTGIGAGIEGSGAGIQDITGGMSEMRQGMVLSKNALTEIQKGLLRIKDEQDKAGQELIKVSDGLRKISSGVSESVNALNTAQTGMQDMREGVDGYVDGKGTIDDVFFLPSQVLEEYPELKDAMRIYISPDGKGLMMEAVLTVSPYSNDALDSIAEMNDIVEFTFKNTELENAEFHIGGATAALSEVRELTNRDFVVVMVFVLLGILVVLVILLKSIIAPIYLILTMLLSFGTTMGICYFVFDVILGNNGLHWAVPFFSFCVLVALGVDYNIFLMSRVKEEYIPGDNTGSIKRALSSTGGIITSCGIIMAGTFSAMLASPIKPIVEVGFAAVVGLIIDTFVIRTLIVPAIAVKLGELNWWPGRKVRIIPMGNDGRH